MPDPGPSNASSTGTADLLLVGGVVYGAGSADAIAVHGGRIAAVGASADVRGLAGPATRVVDLRGRTVLPGFQDAHVHPPTAGLTAMRCELHDQAADPEAYLAVIRSYAAANPDVEWILGGGWAMPAFPGGVPRKEPLDAVVPDRPVYLPSRDGHSAWVNSRALQLAGVTRDTPDPEHGRIERDPDGEPAGTLHEGAMDLVALPVPSGADWEAAILRAQAHLHSLGITAWQDAIVEPDTLAAYRALAERGELTAKVVGALWWDRERGEEQIDELREQRSAATAGRFRATTVKIMQDGVCENFTAAMLDPYFDGHGHRTQNAGISMVEPALLRRVVTLLDREAFQVHVHAIGDRAVREALDAVEAARDANGPWDARHHIAHIQVIHPDDVPRFASLGVVANAQPLWACNEPQMVELTIPFLGPERTARQYPFASLVRAGATLAVGSDWPVSSPNPLLEIEVAVNRIDPLDRHGEPFLPQERLGLGAAIDAFTRGSAFVNRLEGSTGTIEAGASADLAVLDRDLLAPDAGPIGDASVVMTLVDGALVFEDPGLEG